MKWDSQPGHCHGRLDSPFLLSWPGVSFTNCSCDPLPKVAMLHRQRIYDRLHIMSAIIESREKWPLNEDLANIGAINYWHKSLLYWIFRIRSFDNRQTYAFPILLPCMFCKLRVYQIICSTSHHAELAWKENILDGAWRAKLLVVTH